MIATIQKISGSQLDYYKKELLNYYVESDQEGMSRFHGKLARTYGIDGDAITPSETLFPSLFNGFHPFTEEPLVRNAGDPHRVSGYDITFSAPKDLSIIMGLAFATKDFETVRKVWLCQNKAGRTAQEQVQKDLVSRVGQRARYLTKAEGIFAIMNHTTSRRAKGCTYPDPQTHSHAILFNVSQRKDGSTGTVDGRLVLNTENSYAHVLGRIYRTTLAREVTREFGFNCRPVKLSDGESFEVEGIPHEMKRAFSQRRRAIEEKIAKTATEKATTQDYQQASLSTRQAKKTFHRDELHAEWLKVARTHGFDLNVFLRDVKHQVSQLPEKKPSVDRLNIETFEPKVSRTLLTQLRDRGESSRIRRVATNTKQKRDIAS